MIVIISVKSDCLCKKFFFFLFFSSQPDVEFSVRVSFIELYNEELFDLLGCSEDPLRLRLYEDNTKKVDLLFYELS